MCIKYCNDNLKLYDLLKVKVISVLSIFISLIKCQTYSKFAYERKCNKNKLSNECKDNLKEVPSALYNTVNPHFNYRYCMITSD